jgi:hypothetical protein
LTGLCSPLLVVADTSLSEKRACWEGIWGYTTLYCSSVASPIPIVVHGVVAHMYQCAEDSNGSSVALDQGHDLLVWKQLGLTCEVGLHGHSQVNQALDIVIARATFMVLPMN